MKTGLPAITEPESRRIDRIKREVGCIACFLNGHPLGTPADAHHLIDPATGNRISHLATIPLCKAHHLGPYSIHKRKLWFAGRYGSDQDLLDETNAQVLILENNTIGGPI